MSEHATCDNKLIEISLYMDNYHAHHIVSTNSKLIRKEMFIFFNTYSGLFGQTIMICVVHGLIVHILLAFNLEIKLEA